MVLKENSLMRRWCNTSHPLYELGKVSSSMSPRTLEKDLLRRNGGVCQSKFDTGLDTVRVRKRRLKFGIHLIRSDVIIFLNFYFDQLK